MSEETVRRSLYVLFARLLAGPPDADLYRRMRAGGLEALAEVQGVDLTSDLLDPTDPEGAVCELSAEYDRLGPRIAWRASEYNGATADPALAIAAFLREHAMTADGTLPCDHVAIVLNVMGELAGQAERDASGDAPLRARLFFLRHVASWVPSALVEIATHADRKFYRGLAAMLSAFLESERRHFQAA